MEQVAKELSLMNKNFEIIYRKLENIDERFNEMDGKISNIDNKLVEIDGRVTDIDSRVKTIESFERVDQHDISLEAPANKKDLVCKRDPQYHQSQVSAVNRGYTDEPDSAIELRDIGVTHVQRGEGLYEMEALKNSIKNNKFIFYTVLMFTLHSYFRSLHVQYLLLQYL